VPVDCDPATAFEPLHAPPALQLVALLASQVSAALLPLLIVLGLA
jgi:hypothetical protein